MRFRSVRLLLPFFAVLLAGGKALFAGIKETFPLQGGMAAVLALLLVLEVICLLFAVFFGIVLGYRQNKAKAAWSALFALGLYFAVQSVIMTIVCVFAAAGGDMNMFFRTNAAEIDPAVLAGVIKKIVTVSCAAYAVLTAALFFLGRKAFAKGVNVD